MISGYIDMVGQPILSGFVSLPRLKLSGSIRLLVDTGSPATMICPTDAAHLGINHSELGQPGGGFQGFGGNCKSFLEDGVIYFKGKQENAKVGIRLEILEPYEDSDHLPSVIDRDILSSWKMIYDPMNESDPLVFYCNDRALLWPDRK